MRWSLLSRADSDEAAVDLDDRRIVNALVAGNDRLRFRRVGRHGGPEHEGDADGGCPC